MKVLLLILIAVFFIANITSAQQKGDGIKRTTNNYSQTGSVIGKILDGDTHKGIGFATISVLQAKDSIVVAGSLSSANGDFHIDGVSPGQHILRINYIGYHPLYHNFLISQNMALDLGNFIIYQDISQLKTLSVTASSPPYDVHFNKRVFDVSKDITSAGGDASDVLQQIPGVTIDDDGNVSLRNGKPDLYVDGVRTLLTLGEIPADAISKIEIITNPSAKYDAEGKSGIINIILKKNRKPGINGNLLTGVDTHGCYDLDGTLNLYRNPFNLSISLSKHFRHPPYEEIINRQNLYNNTWLYQFTHGRRGRFYQIGNIDLDYSLDSTNTLSFESEIESGGFKDFPGTISNYFNDDKLQDSSALTNSYYKSSFNFYSGDISYKHTFPQKDHVLTANINYRKASIPGENYNTTQFYDNDHNPISESKAQKNITSGTNTYITGQIDYVRPLTERSTLNGGLKVSVLHSGSLYDFYALDSNIYTLNQILSNNYTYKENVYAGYLQYSNRINKLSYQLGLRVEKYIYEGFVPSLNGSFNFDNNSLGFYPSAFLTYAFTEEDKIHLSYSRRVDRPTLWQRIPYINYSNPLSLTKGNPDLNPDYTNAFELDYDRIIGQNNMDVSIYYDNTNNLISTYMESYNNSIDTTISYFINARTNNTYGGEFTLITSIARWWDITTDINIFRVKIDASENSLNFMNKGWSWSGKLNSDIKLPHHFNLQLTGNYNAPVLIPQGTLKGLSALNIAIKKSFLKRQRASMVLSLLDIFNTREKITGYYMPGKFMETSLVKRSPRFLRCSFTYTFGREDSHFLRRKSNTSKQQSLQSGKEINPQGKEEF